METVIKYSDKIYIYQKIIKTKTGYEAMYSLLFRNGNMLVESEATSSLDELKKLYKLNPEHISDIFIEHFLNSIKD